MIEAIPDDPIMIKFQISKGTQDVEMLEGNSGFRKSSVYQFRT